MNTLERTQMGLRCSDCDAVPKVAGAGSIVRDSTGHDVQLMHNGIKVLAGGYHGDWMAELIRGLRGHHEPQEERLFHEVVKSCRHGSLIVELGAFWSYYSLWYLHEVLDSRAICIEPDANNLEIGRTNARLNDASRLEFVQAAIAGAAAEIRSFQTETSGELMLPSLDAPAVLAKAGGPVELLHMDIQGSETAFLKSITAAEASAIRFLFVSTHASAISGSPTTHADCLSLLEAASAQILSEHSVQESFSGDGLIVASFYAEDRNLPMPPISRNEAGRSLFPIP